MPRASQAAGARHNTQMNLTEGKRKKGEVAARQIHGSQSSQPIAEGF